MKYLALLALTACHPSYIHTRSQLQGYCTLQSLRWTPIRTAALVAESRQAGVKLVVRHDSLFCSAIVR